MKALTTKKERMIQMKQLRQVTKTEKILFPIVVTILCFPHAAVRCIPYRLPHARQPSP